MNNKVTEKYGLFVTVSMIVGIVIGSGIFFKADDILATSGGSVLIGVLGFIFVGIGVLFGSLLVAHYAQEDSDEGGVIKYSKNLLGNFYGYVVGWFMVAVYFPALIVILAWAAALYTTILFNLDSGLWVITVFYYSMAVITNYFSTKTGGIVQKYTMIIKLMPLIIVAIFGIIFGGDNTVEGAQTYLMSNNYLTESTTVASISAMLLAIAFSFDGWYVATSISAEVKNSKKTLPKALVIGALIITVVYIAYFVGITKLVGVDNIISSGDAHVNAASNMIFNSPNIINIFVIISIYGGLNGMVLAYFRLPHALVKIGVMKDIKQISKIDEKRELSKTSVLMGIPFVLFFIIIHYLSQSVDSLGNPTNIVSSLGIAIDSLPVFIVYIFMTVLFVGVIKKIRNEEVSKINYIYMFFALLVSLTVILGTLFTNNGFLYVGISVFFIIIGLPLYKKDKK